MLKLKIKIKLELLCIETPGSLKNKIESLQSEITNLKRQITKTDDEKMFVIGHGGQARVAVKNHNASEWSVGTYM